MCIPSSEHAGSVWSGSDWALPIRPSEQNRAALGLKATLPADVFFFSPFNFLLSSYVSCWLS